MIYDVANRFHKQAINDGIFQSCLNCEQWKTKENKCEKFGVTPPAEVIVFSCGKDWMIDIPF